MALTQEAREAKRLYMQEWREKNRERYNEGIRKWKKNNPDKVRQYQENYWNRKAEEIKEG